MAGKSAATETAPAQGRTILILKDPRPGGLNAAIPAVRNAGLPIALYRMATITTGGWPTDASDVLEGLA